MVNLQVDFGKTVGKIKAMHATGQPPFTGGFLQLNFTPMQYLTDAGVPYCRLHDVGGAFGGNRFVDIPNIFRDFDADETLPDSYDFAFTDELIKAMHEYNLRPIFRLGVTIENQAHIKAYRIHPPKDYQKWARICEHIVRHYNEGWANGFHFGITYWEIWNEPENGPKPTLNQMWTGTAEEYYRLYDTTAKHLKNCFGDTIKVGGYGACGFYGIYYHPEKYGVEVETREKDERYEKDIYRVEFLYGFLEYIKEHQSPIDFFSWHSYADVKKTVVMSAFLHRVLREYGYDKLETHLNEWNNAHELQYFAKSYSSAQVAAMMCAMQNSETDKLFYYDSRIFASRYCALFNPYTRMPCCTYYSFIAFNALYALGNQAECVCEKEGVYAVAAVNGKKKAVLIVNTTGENMTVDTKLDKGFTVYLLDEEHFLAPTDCNANSFALNSNQVMLLKNYE
ncbi:MAG: hypothetical protein J6U60_01325 [Clostridia bacterium]|nr:hypothetical protein [Clostridia bacterium]